MNSSDNKVFAAQMELCRPLQWDHASASRSKRNKKQLPKHFKVAAAVSLCFGMGILIYTQMPPQTHAVMSHLTTGFEYDDTLGRLQYVSNILPESAMVFLNTESHAEKTAHVVSSDAHVSHAWSQNEPWLEYNVIGEVASCLDGEIVTVVKNSMDTFTVRLVHKNGYESLYSGLQRVNVREGEQIRAGDQIGTAAGAAAFELRKDGLSVNPTFNE